MADRIAIPGGRTDGGALWPACGNCANFGTDAPAGKMPGVGPSHRLCGLHRVDKSAREWRNPTDWCDQWREKKG
jgi:hypothetical protein